MEITFRKGKALAAYIYLSRKPVTRVFRSKKIYAGIIADFDKDDTLLGLEITAPDKTNAVEINTVLSKYNFHVSEQELAPLKAA